MKAYIANTDYRWYEYLSRRGNVEEVNFWQPSGGQGLTSLNFGEPMIFKLKADHDYAIAGFGLFVAYVKLTVLHAWEQFRQTNGVATIEEMVARLRKYVSRPLTPSHQIGCILLAAPVFLPRSHWVRGPSDWRPQIQRGKYYDLRDGEGKRIWEECLTLAQSLSLPDTAAHNVSFMEERPRYGKGMFVHPRLGQGTFRFAVQRAYGRCAITGEKSLPALEAAHIRPYAFGGRHEIPNGLLLRADIHRLYDGGYVTVTPDLEFRVSPKLDKEFHNGRIYYELDGRQILVPPNEVDLPDEQYLEYHSEKVFLES